MPGFYVIAGGSHGIGLQIVNRLRKHATRILVCSRSVGDLAVDEVVRHHPCDFSEPNGCLPEFQEPIQGVVYCPGSINLRSFRSLKREDFLNDLQVNFLGAVNLLQHCYPGLNLEGPGTSRSVVLFSTVAVSQGLPMHSSIAAAKGAVEGLMRSLAAEWAPKIRVNCIAPALTETPLSRKFFSSESAREALNARYPLGRTGRADELAAAATFLLSEEADWITGQTLGVDGGLSTVRK
ncbi:MAG: SDR family oxidoreductase [Planctomycetaceae bacterium]|nr:SDR family oxidoreductase [Planctomycetaceae bacterium]